MTAPSTPGSSRQRVSDEWLAEECPNYDRAESKGCNIGNGRFALDLRDARAALAKAEAQIAELERERDEARCLNREYLNTPIGRHIARADAAEARITTVREALEIIAGKQQCVDNLMSNVDVANAALALIPAGTSSCVAKDGEAKQ